MARQKKKQGFSFSFPIGTVILILFLGSQFFHNNVMSFFQGVATMLDPLFDANSSYRTTEELDPSIYYENANSLRGNTYKIDAEIDSALGNSPTKGRLYSVTIKNSSKNGAPVVLPVLVPLELGNLTIQKGQHYLMKVKVVDDGLLKVEEARKP